MSLSPNVRLPLRVLAVACLVLVLGCARPKPAAPASTRAPVDHTTRVCTAFAEPGPLGTRFAKVLPLELGGMLYALGGTTPTDLTRALVALGLQDARITACGPDDVVLFMPAVDGDGATRLERALVSALPQLRIKAKDAAGPRQAPPAPRPTRD